MEAWDAAHCQQPWTAREKQHASKARLSPDVGMMAEQSSDEERKGQSRGVRREMPRESHDRESHPGPPDGGCG